jgi:hypothetical protein
MTEAVVSFLTLHSSACPQVIVHPRAPAAPASPPATAAPPPPAGIAARFRTRLCETYEATRRCPYAYRCMFAHGRGQLRTATMNVADGLTSEAAAKAFQKNQQESAQRRKAQYAANHPGTPDQGARTTLPGAGQTLASPLSIAATPIITPSHGHASGAPGSPYTVELAAFIAADDPCPLPAPMHALWPPGAIQSTAEQNAPVGSVEAYCYYCPGGSSTPPPAASAHTSTSTPIYVRQHNPYARLPRPGVSPLAQQDEERNGSFVGIHDVAPNAAQRYVPRALPTAGANATAGTPGPTPDKHGGSMPSPLPRFTGSDIHHYRPEIVGTPPVADLGHSLTSFAAGMDPEESPAQYPKSFGATPPSHAARIPELDRVHGCGPLDDGELPPLPPPLQCGQLPHVDGSCSTPLIHRYDSTSSCDEDAVCSAPWMNPMAPPTTYAAVDSSASFPLMATRYKTKLCETFSAKHKCPYAYRCMFAHGRNQLRSAQQNVDDGLVTEGAIKAFQQKQVELSRQRKAAAGTNGTPFAAGMDPEGSPAQSPTAFDGLVTAQRRGEQHAADHPDTNKLIVPAADANNDATIKAFQPARVERSHQRNVSDVYHSAAAVNDTSSLPLIIPCAALRPEPSSDGSESGGSASTPAQAASVGGGRVLSDDQHYTVALFMPDLPGTFADLVGISTLLHNETASFPTG